MFSIWLFSSTLFVYHFNMSGVISIISRILSFRFSYIWIISSSLDNFTLSTFPFNYINEKRNRTRATFISNEVIESLKSERKQVVVNTDLSFSIQRDLSESSSSISYFRLDIWKVEYFGMSGESGVLTNVDFDGRKYVN